MSNVGHRIVVTSRDCGTTRGIPVDADDEDNIGSVLAADVGPYKAGTIITRDMMGKMGDGKIAVRSLVTCEEGDGVCSKCGGVREKGRLPEIGDPVGIVATRSISEPVTQAGFKAKHSGGVAGSDDKQVSGFKEMNQFVQVPENFLGAATLAGQDGIVTSITKAPAGGYNVKVDDKDETLAEQKVMDAETGEKGAYLTRDLSIPGSCLILMPMNRHLGVSARITDSSERARLQETGMRLSGGSFGLVMREAALRATETELKAELEELRKRWNQILEGDTAGGSIEEELLRDYTPRGITSMIRNQPLSADLSRQLSEAKNRMIRLPHGGNIIIDACEALTVVDVNSASDAAGGNREETALQTNLEACQEIMVQTRLRNLSGILILDMIDMDTETYRQLVLNALEDAFREDRVKTVIHGFTSLGLIEMTRRRTRPTLAEMR